MKTTMRNNGNLTFQQKEFILKNYSNMKTHQICKKLNLTYSQVKSYADNNHLVKNPIASKSCNHYWETCVKKRNNVSYNINDFLGHEKEPCVDNLYKSKYGKYFVNQNYFDIIDNEWKAYWLGFIYADGSNNIRRHNNKNNKMEYIAKLTLATIDENHLYKFRNSLQSDAPIQQRTSYINDKEYYNSTLNICNSKICNDLNKLGCTPCKTLTLKFPNEKEVPSYLIKHFIRGYFDGDGCIYINLDKRQSSFSILGTTDFLNGIANIFYNELNIDKTKLLMKQGTKVHTLYYGSIIDIEKIYNYLYKDCNIYLDRKLKKFDTLLCLN